MVEIELKFAVSNLEDLNKRLSVLGFKKTQPRILEVTAMYDNPEKFLFNKNARLRVRDIGEVCEFSYKQPMPEKDGVKHELEHEVLVSKSGTLKKILEEIDYKLISSYERYRTTFKDVAGTKVTFDEFPFATYVEIEGELTQINSLAETLGFNKSKNITLPCDTLFSQWRKEKAYSQQTLCALQIMTAKELVNKVIGNKRLEKFQYDELVKLAKQLPSEKVLRWLAFVQETEIQGWRSEELTRVLCEKLVAGKEITFYALFCPSYLKGEGQIGFRTDGVGITTVEGLKNLKILTEFTRSLGFKVAPAQAIFFDVALENYEQLKGKGLLEDVNKNYLNFSEIVPQDIICSRLTEIFPRLEVDQQGVTTGELPVTPEVYAKIYQRGLVFYELFGWSPEQIKTRTETVIRSEAIVGKYLAEKFQNGVLVYTPTMLERAQIYNASLPKDKKIPILFPQKGL